MGRRSWVDRNRIPACAGGWVGGACKTARQRAIRLPYFTLTSLTSNTTAWFGPIGDCGVSP